MSKSLSLSLSLHLFYNSAVADNKHQQKINQIITDLRSKKEVSISSALKAIHVHGDANIIPVVLEIWAGGLSDKNDNEVRELLIGLKDTSTIEPLMEGFRESEDNVFRRKLLSVFWNSNLDFSEYLSDFVLFGLEGDFMDCLESLTVIEQFENTVPESAILESQLLLKEYFSKEQPTEEKKLQLLQEIMLRIKDFEEGADMDGMYFDEDEDD